MLKHSLLVFACWISQTALADENQARNDSQINEIAKLTARIEQLEKRLEELEQQNARQPSVTVVPHHQPYNTPQYQAPRSKPNIPNINPNPTYPEPYGPRPQYVPQTPPAVPYQPQNPPNNAVPDSWKPFDFNGMQYYIIPVDEAQRINPLSQDDRTMP